MFIVYCSPKFQYNNCVAIQSSTPSSWNTNPATTHPSCNTIRVLQYNGSTTNLPIAIQFNTLHSLYCNTPWCLAIQFLSLAAAPLQYTSLYCNTIFQPLSPPKLQYNFPYCNTLANKPSLAIQLSLKRLPIAIQLPTKLYHNTIWAVAQISYAPYIYIFFSFFFLLFFYLFQPLENTKKKYIYLFLFFF